MLSFSSLSQIPSSPLPLPISFFPPYFTFLLPLRFFFLCNPQWSRGTHFLALSLQRRSTLQPCTFPYLCSSFFFFLHYFSLLLSMPSAFTCSQACVLHDKDIPAPQPHIYLGNLGADDIPGCQCAAPNLPLGWSGVSPEQDRSVKEVGG